ncbi:MAG: type I restriction-modification system subunit M [Treponemataceae bacterium]|nr:type I restriction-modification system subunit M [Treponemataceae bacterium]
MNNNKISDTMWDDNPIDITQEANFIWSIANKLRGSYMPDHYGDVIIPMTILRRFECALEEKKRKVVDAFKADSALPYKKLCKISGFQFYNTSEYTLAELCNDSKRIAVNFKNYLEGFSPNVYEIFSDLEMFKHIDKMDKDGCLYTVVEAFATLDLSIQTYDSIKMGYIFENLIGRFFQNVDAGQFYTGRDIIKLLVEILLAEGCDDIFDSHKVITVLDQACGTGGMLSTAYSYIMHYNPTAEVRLFGQEFMGQTYAIGLAEMLIKNQDADNFRHVDTFKEDCFPDTKMRFVIENPPFGTPWSGKDAKAGQEEAVREEYAKGADASRWGHGLPSGGDSQMIFLQSAVDKMDDSCGRAAIIENGSPLFNGDTASGESQIRRWLLERDLIEAIIALPTDLFYNTGIQTYVWILSKNKRKERRGKIQLINAADIYHKLRKAVGNKKNEITKEDRKAITHLYADFVPAENCKIFDNTEFLYREYAVMQPLQRNYAITEERIEQMLAKGTLSSIYDEAKVAEFESHGIAIEEKDRRKYEAMLNNKPLYESILRTLKANVSDKVYKEPKGFVERLSAILPADKKLIEKIAAGLSEMDKTAEIQRDKNGDILYDKETYDKEIVRYAENIEDYMAREVLPYVPDAQWFWEENLGAKKPVIKVGAEIPFTRYFYKYSQSQPSAELAAKFMELEASVSERIKGLFGEK